MRSKKSKAYLSAFIVSVCLMPIVVWAFASNPPLNSSSAPGDSTCASCHSGGAQAGHVAITVAGGNTYTPGTAKQVTVTITDPNATLWGYEITSVEASSTSTGAGTFTALDANSNVRLSGTKSYAAQTNDGVSTYQLSWMPPASSVGNIALYVSSVGGHSGGPGGDSVYNSSLTLTPAVSTSPSISLSPSTLSFSATAGGTAPAAKTIAVASSTSAALSYTVSTTTSATWLKATPASGSTPGTISVLVSPTGLAAGTYTGTVTVASSGSSNSPQTVAVSFAVTSSAQPSLAVSPASLSFAATVGGTAPAAKDIALSSSSPALSYTVSATNSATWLKATPASGSTPGTISVSVNPAGLAAGTYNASVSIASTGAANSPQTVPVTLTVSGAGGGGTVATAPRYLRFTGAWKGSNPHSQSLHVTGTAHGFTAKEYGATWLSVSPAAGAAPGTVTVKVETADLVPGHYAAVIDVSAPGGASTFVPVMLTVQSGSGTGGGGGESDASTSFMAAAYTYDPANTGGVAAQWVSGAGVPSDDPKDPTNEGLLLTNNVSAPGKARAGVVFANVEGITLSALGFDIRQASLCSAHGPYFIVQTQDGVNHTLGGCNTANIQPAPAAGWTRFRFNPAEASPAIGPDETVKSISLMMDQGPDKNSGHAVLDNLNINDQFIGHE